MGGRAVLEDAQITSVDTGATWSATVDNVVHRAFTVEIFPLFSRKTAKKREYLDSERMW